jgi:valyl-tRNA synthetase
LFAGAQGPASIHNSQWPQPRQPGETRSFLASGDLLIAIASAVRRYKSENALSLGSEINRLQIVTQDPDQARFLQEAVADITSITRTRCLEIASLLDPDAIRLVLEGDAVQVGIVE